MKTLFELVVTEKISAVQLGAISELWMKIKTSSELVHWLLVVTVLRPVARRRLVETES
jgi:hypothetical protein